MLQNGAGVHDSSDEEEESGVSDGWSQSTGRGVSASMQTSLTRNQSASVQTEAIGVDAETLVDEFFTDDSEKKVGFLLLSAMAVLVPLGRPNNQCKIYSSNVK